MCALVLRVEEKGSHRRTVQNAKAWNAKSFFRGAKKAFILPWRLICVFVQDIQSQVHRAQRCICKRKRAKNFVLEAQREAKSKGITSSLRKLRMVRKTRFNSRVQVLDSYLHNVPVMRRVIANERFVACIKASKETTQKKLDACLKTWTADPPYFRARRALFICGPVASLSRKVAGQDFFAVYPIFLDTRKDVLAALDANDFADSTKREDAGTVAARRREIENVLTKRGEVFSTAVHKAAWVLDPRVVEFYLSPEGSQLHPEARQEAIRTTMSDFIPRFWPQQDWLLLSFDFFFPGHTQHAVMFECFLCFWNTFFGGPRSFFTKWKKGLEMFFRRRSLSGGRGGRGLFLGPVASHRDGSWP